MDIKAKVEEVVKKVQADPSIASSFEKEPVKTVEGIIGVDLPDDVINNVVDGVKAKLSADAAGGLVDKVKGLFS
ncbi:MAG: hypothetical protein IKG93_12540 [Clostridiales bacterium]|nr:hypothetical protein [Clostridiales bacterium]